MTMSVVAVIVGLVLRLVGVSNVLDNRLEAIVVIGSVLHNASASIGLLHGVATLDLVAITRLPLLLNVARFGILDAIVELVFGMMMRLLCHMMMLWCPVHRLWFRSYIVVLLLWCPVVLLFMAMPLLGRLMMRLYAVTHAVIMLVATMRYVAGSRNAQQCAADQSQFLSHF